MPRSGREIARNRKPRSLRAERDARDHMVQDQSERRLRVELYDRIYSSMTFTERDEIKAAAKTIREGGIPSGWIRRKLRDGTLVFERDLRD